MSQYTLNSCVKHFIILNAPRSLSSFSCLSFRMTLMVLMPSCLAYWISCSQSMQGRRSAALRILSDHAHVGAADQQLQLISNSNLSAAPTYHDKLHIEQRIHTSLEEEQRRTHGAQSVQAYKVSEAPCGPAQRRRRWTAASRPATKYICRSKQKGKKTRVQGIDLHRSEW